MQELEKCKHEKLLTYIGYVNVYFCPCCGLRFNTEPKYDQTIEGNKCEYNNMLKFTQ